MLSILSENKKAQSCMVINAILRSQHYRIIALERICIIIQPSYQLTDYCKCQRATYLEYAVLTSAFSHSSVHLSLCRLINALSNQAELDLQNSRI